MYKALSHLVKVANELDKSGFYSDADRLDTLIRIATGERTRAVENFIQELKRIFTVVANSPQVPSINQENLEVILNVIDTLAGKGTFLDPSSSSSTWEKIKEFDEGIIGFVEGLIELEESIKKLKDQLVREKDPTKRESINQEMEREHDRVVKLMEQVTHWKNGKRKDDTEKYNKFLELYGQRKKELGLS